MDVIRNSVFGGVGQPHHEFTLVLTQDELELVYAGMELLLDRAELNSPLYIRIRAARKPLIPWSVSS